MTVRESLFSVGGVRPLGNYADWFRSVVSETDGSVRQIEFPGTAYVKGVLHDRVFVYDSTQTFSVLTLE